MEILVFIFFTLCAFSLYKKNREIGLACVLFSIYAFSAFFSILIKIRSREFASINYETNLVNAVIFCTFIFSCIIPYKKISIDEIKPLGKNQMHIFNAYCYLSMVSFVAQLFDKGSLLVGLATGEWGSVRKEFYRSMLDTIDTTQSIWMYIPNIITANYSITLLFFFFSITVLQKNTWFNVALFVSSTGAIMTDMVQASRTSGIFWILMVIVLYVVFSKKMTEKKRHRIRLILVSGISLIFLYLMSVTISRFDESIGTDNSIVKYMGEPFISFSNIWNNYINKEIYFGRLFPISSKYIFHSDINLHVYRDIVSSSTVEVNQFITHYGDAIVDFGRFGAIIYAILIYVIQRHFLQSSKVCSLSSLIILVLFVRIPLHGMFAYVYGSITPMLTVFFSLFMVLLLKKQ